MRRTIITAHAGCEGTEAGSMESVLVALKLNADVIEVDLRMHDGIIYLAHDSIDIDHLDDYLTFKEVLDRLSLEKVKINCDLKEREILPYALKLLREYGMEERAIFTGSYFADVDTDAKYKYFLNVNSNGFTLSNDKIGEKEADIMIDFNKRKNDPAMDAFNLNYRNVSPEAIKKLDEAGVRICYWTVDDPEALEHMLRNNVFAITTRYVSEAIALRKRIQGE
ncbi:MAG: glycerophosphodiester phosphodiesterase [Clostridiales bacterium]|jgi:glycerophosphoryl diester phosphodiesterase|nr:glycerophosphodiester phosphodiesterase [Clostridiales bacterium]